VKEEEEQVKVKKEEEQVEFGGFACSFFSLRLLEHLKNPRHLWHGPFFDPTDF
jgi:hypothetical protein